MNEEAYIKMQNILEKLADCGTWYTSALEIDTYEGYDGEDIYKEIKDSLSCADNDPSCYTVEDTSMRWAPAHIAYAMYKVLEELEESSKYWSEYDVPIGIVDDIQKALMIARGES